MEIEPEEVTRLIDGVYKNIIEKFNPCARNLIAAGKAYLKALQGVNTASSVFNDCLSKIAFNAQQSPSSDIGDVLLNVVNQFNAIQDQHINIIKAFYVDLLMPLENNLEKDAKIVQVEQKKYLQQHKNNLDNFCKAVTTLKKQRKKKNASGNTSKELKSLQQVEEQKNKLKNFCNQSLKHALTQERRRYGFVLERQCSIAKHWLTYYETGKSLENNIDEWISVASTREHFNMEEYFTKKYKKATENDMDSTMLRKTRSMDVNSGENNKSVNDNSYTQNSLPRTKSEHNLASSSTKNENNDNIIILKTIYSYESTGKNQLNFDEGDRIILIENRSNGWQFGENMRTKELGWYPSTYVEKENLKSSRNSFQTDETPRSTLKRNQSSNHAGNHELSPSRMFGDTLMFRNTKYFQRISPSDLRTSPPPALPPPIPTSYANSDLNGPQSYNEYGEPRRSGLMKVHSHKYIENDHGNRKINSTGPPPQPEIDYSDEEKEKLSRIPLKHESPITTTTTNESNTSTLKKSSSFESVNSNNNKNNINNNINNNNNNIYGINPSNTNNIINNNDKIIDLNTINRKGNFIKRTKSLWKTKKSDENMDEKNLWKHKDLMQQQNDDMKSIKRNNFDSLDNDRTLKRNNQNNNEKLEYYMNARKSISIQNNEEIHKNNNGTNNFTNNNNNNNHNHNHNHNKNNNNKNLNNNYDSGTMQTALINYNKDEYFDSDSDLTLKIQDHNSFDDDSRIGINGGSNGIKKTVKRREILKQYYSSDDDHHNDDDDDDDDDDSETESQDYDCIVINDHLVNKTNKTNVNNKMEFKTFTGGKINNQATNNSLKLIDSERKNLNSINSNTTVLTTTTGTLLPRTKLLNKSQDKKLNQNSNSKANNNVNSVNNKLIKNRYLNETDVKSIDGIQHHQLQQQQSQHLQKSYGPWYDLWDPNDSTINKDLKTNYH